MLDQIEGTDLWVDSFHSTSNSGKTRHRCSFGFKKKTSPDKIEIIPILYLPEIHNNMYLWKVTHNSLTVREQKNNRVILQMPLQLLHKLAQLSPDLDTKQSNEEMGPPPSFQFEVLD